MSRVIRAPPPRPALKRSLGLWMATALVIGNMVGSGVFGLPASLASTGPISLLAWGFTGAGAILLALVFANLGRAYPQTGGPYAYARRAFGDFAGFWTAWGYWIAAWAGNAAIAVIFVSYATVFWPSLATNNVLAFAVGLAVIWLLTLVNIAGVRESGHRPARDDRAQVRAAAADRRDRPLLHAQRQLHAVRSATTSRSSATGTRSRSRPRSRCGRSSASSRPRSRPRRSRIPSARSRARRCSARSPRPRMYVLATVAIMGVIPAATLAKSNAPFADAAHADLRLVDPRHVARARSSPPSP